MYQPYFGLTGKPFQLTPDPTFYFASKGHTRALSYLEYGLHQGEGFIVITGEVGTGKTTLLRGLLGRLDPRSIVAVQIVSTQVDADDLVRLVADAFGIPTRSMSKSDLLGLLQLHFRGLHAHGQRALLVIDEVQNLSQRAIEELRMLSNFQSDTSPLLQSFLVGQPEFRALMRRTEMLQLKQRVIASYHLGPLDQADTREYILHRLRRVGWNENPSFDESAFERIYRFSEGVPRRINALCDRLLLSAYISERNSIGIDEVEMVTNEFLDELSGPPAGDVVELPAARKNQSATDALTYGHSDDELLQADLLSLRSRVSMLEWSVDGNKRALKRLLAMLGKDTGRESESS
jgi:general secretion pathway protein A